VYKATRDNGAGKNMFDPDIFAFMHSDVLPNLMQKYPFVRTCAVDRAEADDIIAIIVNVLRKDTERYDCDEIVVITNDQDYLQLLDDVDGIYNLQGIDMATKTCFEHAYKNMLMKVLTGDKSDNIKGIWSKSRSIKLLTKFDSQSDIEEHFRIHASTAELQAFNLNKTLICFSKIPTYISETVEHDLIAKLG
jgi:5'-3' exonuclease